MFVVNCVCFLLVLLITTPGGIVALGYTVACRPATLRFKYVSGSAQRRINFYCHWLFVYSTNTSTVPSI